MKTLFSMAYILSNMVSASCLQRDVLLGNAPVKTIQLLWRTRLRKYTVLTLKKNKTESTVTIFSLLSCLAPALGSNDLMFGRCLFCSSHANPPKLSQFGNVLGNRGRELEQEREKLCCLSTAECLPGTGSSPCCCYSVCDFGKLLEACCEIIVLRALGAFWRPRIWLCKVSGAGALCV